MAEFEEPKKGRRELFMERLKTKYPDQEYADDEALYGRIDDDYNDYENQLNGYREREGKLVGVLDTNPRAAQFLADIANGVDPFIGYVKAVGVDALTEMMNGEKKEEVAQAHKEYLERVAKDKEIKDSIKQNLPATVKMREEMDAKYGEEIVNKALDLISKICDDNLVGIIAPETFEMAVNMVNRDADLANARSEGEIAGKNAKIEEKMRKPKAGDGLPVMGGATAPEPAPKKRGFFDDLPKRKF